MHAPATPGTSDSGDAAGWDPEPGPDPDENPEDGNNPEDEDYCEGVPNEDGGITY